MSNVTNAEIAKAFRDGKSRLARTSDEWRMGQKQEFICHSIREHTPACRAAVKIITDRLGPQVTIVGWLVTFVPGARDLSVGNHAKFQDEVQAYRHRWLDALIEEFSE